MKNVNLDSLPDESALDARAVASLLNIGYVKALRLMQYGGMNSVKIGNVYRVGKKNFMDWLNDSKPKIIDLD